MQYPNIQKKNQALDEFLIDLVDQKLPKLINKLEGNRLYLLSNSMSVDELGEAINKPISHIINFFLEKSSIASQNQSLSFDLISEYCQENKLEIVKVNELNFNEIIREYLKNSTEGCQEVKRPLVVSIMGHIDHGKTTLLDNISQTEKQKKEAGGITQKISFSQIEFQGEKIIFLDTPGHSDFIRLRQRGISLTDLVVLVISASDGVMPQTVEIINYLHENKLPTIVFINHKKPNETNNGVALNKIKSQLQERQLTPLEWGGETIVISGSAKEKKDINNLLNNILVFADFKTNLSGPTHGLVLDSYLHSNLLITEVLIQGGQLCNKDIIFLNGKFESIKIQSIDGKRLETASLGEIVKITGLSSSSELGNKFLVVNNEKTKQSLEKKLKDYFRKAKKHSFPLINKEKKNINLALLTNSKNSLETLNSLVKKKNANNNINFSIINTSVGILKDSDIDLIKHTRSVILAFDYSLNKNLEKKLKENSITLFNSRIIYEISEKLDEIINGQQETVEVEEVLGTAVVKVIFEFSKGNIAGCQVINGKISRNKPVYVLRGKEKKKLFVGEIKSLESNKAEKNEVSSGQECGIVLKGFDKFQERDEIVSFQQTTKQKNVN